MQPHDFLIFAVGLVLGWCLNHFRPYTEKRKTPRKRAERAKAITSGTEATRKAGRPRKAPKTPEDPGPALPMGTDDPSSA